MNKLRFIFLLSLVSVKVFSQDIDLRILKSINQTEHKLWDESMKAASDGVYPFMIVSPAALWLTGYANKDETMKRNSVKTVVAIGATILIAEGLKQSVRRKRPYDQYPDDIIARKKSPGFSFPSGHTSAVFATATALTLSTKKWYVGVPAFAYAGLVGYSRMRLGAHYASDVLAGIVVGIGTSLLTWQCDKWINHK